MKYLIEHSDILHSGDLVDALPEAIHIVDKKEEPEDGFHYIFEIARIWKVERQAPRLIETYRE